MSSFNFLEQIPTSSSSSSDEESNNHDNTYTETGNRDRQNEKVTNDGVRESKNQKLDECRKNVDDDDEDDDKEEDLMRRLRLSPVKVKDKRISLLKKEGGDGHRLSDCSYDSAEGVGADGLSLSDSCCESFSSSNMSVNDMTIL